MQRKSTNSEINDKVKLTITIKVKNNDVISKIGNKKIKTTDKLISHFTKKRIPDNLVFEYRNIYYNE